jgi:hypothetical protein
VAGAELEERVQRVVEAAVAARRSELEQLVEARVDAELEQLAGELVAARLAPAKRACSVCGVEPRLPQRTVCRPCLRVRARELHAARRRNGGGPGDDEEPHQAGRVNGNGRRHGGRVGRPWTRPEPPTEEEGSPELAAGGIAAAELARHANNGNRLLDLPAAGLETWLLDAGLAKRTAAGLLVPTGRAASPTADAHALASAALRLARRSTSLSALSSSTFTASEESLGGAVVIVSSSRVMPPRGRPSATASPRLPRPLRPE